jgi:DNA-binding NarL/FixJ family response regulator
VTAKRTTTPPRLLVIDNDARYGEWLSHHLGVLCPDSSVSVLDLAEFERWCDTLSGRDCDVLLLTASFGSSPEDPTALGLELLRRLRGRPVFPAVIALAEDGNELTAVRALQLGAVDYLPKRLLTPERLNTSVRLALRRIEKRVARRLASLTHVTEPPVPDADAKPKAGPGMAAVTSTPSPAGEEAAAKAAAKSDDRARDRPPPDGRPADHLATEGRAADPGAGHPGAGHPAPAAIAPAKAGAEFIPGYVIRMKIGESEKAVVYLATSVSLGLNVALKVSKTLRDDAAGRQFLEREYTAIIAIRDPLVVQIYDYGVHAGFEYLAMEYLLRGDLKARLQLGVTEVVALRYVEQIARALRVVHNAGLLHRDLKPPNVMLRDNDDVALIDFGLARALDGSTPSTRTGVLRGSPYYMSPEQALGEQLDVRSDFYSLGIMLYEMLTGRKPYTGGTAMEVLQQHVNSPLPPLPHSLTRYEPFLARLVAKARHERFAKAEEIIAAIGELRTAMTLTVESTAA